MAMMTDVSKSIVLRYPERGSYTFSRIALAASDTQMHGLAMNLNGLQDTQAERVVKVETKLVI